MLITINSELKLIKSLLNNLREHFFLILKKQFFEKIWNPLFFEFQTTYN